MADTNARGQHQYGSECHGDKGPRMAPIGLWRRPDPSGRTRSTPSLPWGRRIPGARSGCTGARCTGARRGRHGARSEGLATGIHGDVLGPNLMAPGRPGITGAIGADLLRPAHWSGNRSWVRCRRRDRRESNCVLSSWIGCRHRNGSCGPELVATWIYPVFIHRSSIGRGRAQLSVPRTSKETPST